ncbi:MAG: phenylalanine--tRNA ligase subunit alpha [bacterium]
MAGPDYRQIEEQARAAFEGLEDLKALEDARVTWLGRKGRISELMGRIPDLEPEERPEAGRRLNRLKRELEEIHAGLLEEFQERGGGVEEAVDLTHPGRRPFVGRHHVLTRTLRETEEVFREMGFSVAEGPDVETEYYNFEALNMPAHHPARGMWDTFWTKVPPGMVLRTHTSPAQIREMEKSEPPIRIIVPGRCYRADTPDATHSPVFHQIEGLYVDEGVGMPHLRGVLDVFAHRLFGQTLPTRFRPSYFPFTEPSAELDIGCFSCGGEGCRICKGTGWVEILGCGMVNPRLYDHVGYDADRLTGYAFGMGIERIAMLRHGIDDIRLLYENDLRFLEQV